MAHASPRRRIAAALAVLFLFFGGMLAAAPASAHGGPIGAQVSATSAGAVHVYLFYERDLHVIDQVTRTTVEGTSGGASVGPIELAPSDRHGGLWEAPEGAFPDGEWTLSVRYTVGGVESTIAQSFEIDVAAGAQPASVPVWPLLVAGGAVLLLIAFIVAIAVRRRSRADSAR